MAADQKLIDKIIGLRAKADSTTFTAEAEAFRAGATRIMAKYGIVESDLVRDPWAGIKVEYGTYNPGSTWTPPRREYRADSKGATTVNWIFSENNYYLPGKREILEALGAIHQVSVIVWSSSPKAQSARLTGTTDHINAVKDTYDDAMRDAESGMPKDVKRVKSAHTAYLQGFAAGMRQSTSGREQVCYAKNFGAWTMGVTAGRKF